MKFSHLLHFLMFASVAAQALSASQGLPVLSHGKSLSVEKEDDFLVSPNGTFTSGFYKVGTNAYCFSIWFTNSVDKTVVWMANRDVPVNGKQSKLTLHASGNLVLTDADGSVIWSTNTRSGEGNEVQLLETGNLVLINQVGNAIWQSFDFPMDTILPSQRFTKNTTLVSIRSQGTYLSGFYNFKFDDSNVLNLVYNGPQISSVYWPDGSTNVFTYGRTPYNSTRLAILDESGSFTASDNLVFNASDYGVGPKRRLTLDYDGLLRLYSLDASTGVWKVTWLPALLGACRVQGLCGEYGICRYNQLATCSCPSGFKRNDPSDWTKGCSPYFNLTCNSSQWDFTELPYTDFYGYDTASYSSGGTFEACRNSCLTDCECKGFGYSLDDLQCYPKSKLLNGYQLPSNRMTMYVKVPKGNLSFVAEQDSGLTCSNTELILNGNIANEENTARNQYMKYLFSFVAFIGAVEIVFIGLGWWYAFGKHAQQELVNMGYIALALGFKRFSYVELKRATKNFKQQVGKGGFGTVYKGVLDDGRVVAVKRLEGLLQGDSEFWAEVSIIGKLNHRNLVKLWGFCAENEHKMLVYEYMDNGSLDKILFSDSSSALSWNQRYEIAVSTAKGLSYLHEECLEWVLHCDVKPQNILLDNEFEAKVADFGMSKLFKDNNDTGFSRVRGTRGYLAPEWFKNLKIDAKADVYSYGIVLLELVTGRSASSFLSAINNDNECNHLVEWVVQKINKEGIEEVIDARLNGDYNEDMAERLVKVALLCVDEDRQTRPAMSKVVELLVGLGYKESRPREEILD